MHVWTISSKNKFVDQKNKMQTIDFGFIGNYRNLLGEDLESLGIKELEQLEKQLDSSLRHIRSTRVIH